MANRIIEILLQIKSDLAGAKAAEKSLDDLVDSVGKLEQGHVDAKEASDDATTAAKTGAEQSAASVDKHVDAVEELKDATVDAAAAAKTGADQAAASTDKQVDAVEKLAPAYDAAGKEARETGSAMKQTSVTVEQAVEAAARAGKKIVGTLGQTSKGAGQVAAAGTKLKVVGDVLKNIAQLNFQGAAASLNQLGPGVRKFIGIVSSGLTAVTVWVKNIKEWAQAAREVKQADLQSVADGIASSADAATASFERMTAAVRAAAEEMKAMREAQDTLEGAERELQSADLERRRQKALAGVDDEGERDRINQDFDVEVASMKETWAAADARTAVDRNAEDAAAKRAEAQRLREQVKRNSSAFGTMTAHQGMLQEEIGGIVEQNPFSKAAADLWHRNTAKDRAEPYQKMLDELERKKQEVIAKNRELAAEIKALEAEASRMETLGAEALGKKETAVHVETQAAALARADAARRAKSNVPSRATAPRDGLQREREPPEETAPSTPNRSAASKPLTREERMAQFAAEQEQLRREARDRSARTIHGAGKASPDRLGDAATAAETLAEQAEKSSSAISAALLKTVAAFCRQEQAAKLLEEKLKNLPSR